jgi:hypothetical protein
MLGGRRATRTGVRDAPRIRPAASPSTVPTPLSHAAPLVEAAGGEFSPQQPKGCVDPVLMSHQQVASHAYKKPQAYFDELRLRSCELQRWVGPGGGWSNRGGVGTRGGQGCRRRQSETSYVVVNDSVYYYLLVHNKKLSAPKRTSFGWVGDSSRKNHSSSMSSIRSFSRPQFYGSFTVVYRGSEGYLYEVPT